MGEDNNVNIPPELIEYIKKKVMEEKREEEKKEREKAIAELKKYIPHLVDVPTDAEVKHIRTVAAFLRKCVYKPREQRTNFKFDVKKNMMTFILLGAIIAVGILGVIF